MHFDKLSHAENHEKFRLPLTAGGELEASNSGGK